MVLPNLKCFNIEKCLIIGKLFKVKTPDGRGAYYVERGIPNGCKEKPRTRSILAAAVHRPPTD
jgi:hypothetical protein